MRGLWRSLAYLSEDLNGFSSKLSAVTNQVTDASLKHGVLITAGPRPALTLDLDQQATPAILNDIDAVLRPYGLILCVYELAELNRLVCVNKNGDPPYKNLKAYWSGLGQFARDNRDHYEFMEAVGALAVDNTTRFEFAQNGVSLTKWFPQITPDQEYGLRSALKANQPADLSAQEFSVRSWSTPCLSVVAMWDAGWFGLNT